MTIDLQQKRHVNTRVQSLIVYMALFFLINLSGSPIFHMIRYQSSVMIVFALSVCLYLWYRMHSSREFTENRGVVFSILLIGLSLLMTVFVNNAVVSTYFAIFIQFVSAIILTKVIGFESFQKCYTRLITLLAIISLVMFYAQKILIPSIPFMFPVETGTYMYYYKVFYLYNYAAPLAVPDFIWPRNFGIFWEPGCYQFFLNLGLCFLLYTSNGEKKTQITDAQAVSIIILTLTVISTASTTGIVLMLMIWACNLRTIAGCFLNRKIKNMLYLIVLIVFLVAISFSGYINILSEVQESLSKVNSATYLGENGYVQRLSLDMLPYLIKDGYPHLFGISFQTLYADTNANIWNSILEDMVALGYLFIGIFFVGLVLFIKRFSKGRIVILTVIIFSLSNTPLLHTAFVFMLLCYGFRKDSFNPKAL
jgi:hypothetical protein